MATASRRPAATANITAASTSVRENHRGALCVVTPLANESDTLCEFLTRVAAQLLEHDCVFCVLDRTSKDNTRELVEAFCMQEPRVQLVWAPENRCVVDAYFAGYRAALATNCEWIIEMDGGLSHAPEEIPRFLHQMELGYDYVGGCRFMKGGAHHGGFKRKSISYGGTIVANWLLNTSLKDMTGGFQGFSRNALQHVVERGVKSRAHFFQTEIKYMLRAWKCVEVPITYRCPSSRIGSAAIWDALLNLRRLRSTG